MAHELSVRADGFVEAAFAGAVPWHGLGVMVKELMAPFQAIKEAQLEWVVNKRPLWVRALPDSKAEQIPDRFAVVRSDTGAYLGNVGPNYTPIQHNEQAEFIEALVGEGNAVVECIGALFGGRRTFWTCKLPQDLVLDGTDRIKQYLLLMNAHDGSMSFRAFWSPIRVVCNNTLNAALSRQKQDSGDVWIRHTKNAKDRIKEAKQILGLAKDYYEQLGDEFGVMSQKIVERETAESYFNEIFPQKENETEKEFVKRGEIATQITKNLHDDLRITERVHRPSVWNLYNAVTYWTSHQMPQRAKDQMVAREKAFDNIMVGAGRRLQQKAFDLARVLAHA